jgi:CheY-like chemotaxis protein
MAASMMARGPQALPHRVLVVDDAPEVRDVHVRFLHSSGMEVFTAATGIEALETARRAVPDIIVLDVNMPAMDGLTLCRRLRANAATQHLVLVVVTGDAEGRALAAHAAGCDAILGKPCSRDLLVATIQRLVEGR